MPIEIGHLSIKSSIVQRAADAADNSGEAPVSASLPDGAPVFDEQARAALLAECRTMVLDLLARARER